MEFGVVLLVGLLKKARLRFCANFLTPMAFKCFLSLRSFSFLMFLCLTKRTFLLSDVAFSSFWLTSSILLLRLSFLGRSDEKIILAVG